eukprot:TRINITY_DN5676_c0_g1_i1.p3 TRINITY_DN5676_c0_g1~~TRINITY_DN5676_c0_g1_i1.p3  ORF type:complete len:102 (+),score=2.32 TRINITY_DN5676_c0_g1_i1:192-497(+)
MLSSVWRLCHRMQVLSAIWVCFGVGTRCVLLWRNFSSAMARFLKCLKCCQHSYFLLLDCECLRVSELLFVSWLFFRRGASAKVQNDFAFRENGKGYNATAL